MSGIDVGMVPRWRRTFGASPGDILRRGRRQWKNRGPRPVVDSIKCREKVNAWWEHDPKPSSKPAIRRWKPVAWSEWPKEAPV